jgi:hypothetical protein
VTVTCTKLIVGLLTYITKVGAKITHSVAHCFSICRDLFPNFGQHHLQYDTDVSKIVVCFLLASNMIILIGIAPTFFNWLPEATTLKTLFKENNIVLMPIQMKQ